MPRDSFLLVPAAVIAAILGACGDDAPSEIDGGLIECTTPSAERYLPLVIGATWTYDTSDMGAPVVVKTSTVEALEDVGERKAGVTAFRVRTVKTGGAGELGDVVSWQEDRCTSIVRHREQQFDPAAALVTDQFYVPGKLRVDESAARLTVGARYTISYTEVEVDNIPGDTTTTKDEVWMVEAVDEMLTVSAGTFLTLRVRKTTSGNADKTYWFVKGVGKVREMGEQIEDLTAYSIPGLP
jgi:hypothetical protein